MRRGDFLKLSAAGVAGVVVASLHQSFAAPEAKAASAEASAGGVSGDGDLAREFREAARKYGVPAGLLAAMGYVNTRWEMPAADASEYEEGELHGWGGYGMMALVKNPSSDTLGGASRLTGISEEKLKTDRRSNVMGGAALLADSMGGAKRKGAALEESLEREAKGWFGAVSGRGQKRSLEAASGIGGGEVYAGQVFDALGRGVSGKTESGEKVEVKARGGFDLGSRASELREMGYEKAVAAGGKG